MVIFIIIMHKRICCFAILVVRQIFDHIFGPKDKHFPLYLFAAESRCHLYSCNIFEDWRLRHFINIFLYNTIPVLKKGICKTLSLTGSQLIFLKCDGSVRDFWGKFKQKQGHLFWAFFSLISNFSNIVIFKQDARVICMQIGCSFW